MHTPPEHNAFKHQSASLKNSCVPRVATQKNYSDVRRKDIHGLGQSFARSPIGGRIRKDEWVWGVSYRAKKMHRAT